jgi:hypothetical protein
VRLGSEDPRASEAASPCRSGRFMKRPGARRRDDSEVRTPVDFRALLPVASPLREHRRLVRRSARCSPGLWSSPGLSARAPRAGVATAAPPTGLAWAPLNRPEGRSSSESRACPSESSQHRGWPHRSGAAGPPEVLPPRTRPRRLGSRLALAHGFTSGPGCVATASETLFGR